MAGFLYSSCNFQLFWKGLPGPQNRISLRLYFIPSVKNALCTKYYILWLDIVPFFINSFYLRSPIEVVAHSRALVSRTEKQKRKNKGKALPGNKQNLAGKFCVVAGEFSDLRCLMNTLATIIKLHCIKINTIIIIMYYLPSFN